MKYNIIPAILNTILITLQSASLACVMVLLGKLELAILSLFAFFVGYVTLSFPTLKNDSPKWLIFIWGGFWEEYFFRLCLQNQLRRSCKFFGRYRNLFAVIITSLLFSACHYIDNREIFHFGTFFIRFQCGFILGYIALNMSFRHAVLTHIFYNLIVTYLI